MLRVSLSQVRRTGDGDVPELLAQLLVDESGITAEAGERVDEVLAIPVLDPKAGERIESGEDPVRWARLLPTAIRSGDLVVFVKEVAMPAPEEKSGPMATLAGELVESQPAVTTC